MRQRTKSKTYKKTTKKRKSRRNKMKGGSCGCNNSPVITGGLADSTYYYALNTHDIDPNSPSSIINSRLQPNVTLGGRKNHRKSKKMKGGAIDMTYIFDKVAIPFFPASNYMNPVAGSGTTAGAIASNSILTGNVTATNPSQIVTSKNNIGEYLV